MVVNFYHKNKGIEQESVAAGTAAFEGVEKAARAQIDDEARSGSDFNIIAMTTKFSSRASSRRCQSCSRAAADVLLMSVVSSIRRFKS